MRWKILAALLAFVAVACASEPTAEEILADYPDLEAEDIRACLAYASRYLDHSVLVAA